MARVLVVTNMWPGERSPYFGIFVRQQVEALRRLAPDWIFDVEVVSARRGRADYLLSVPRLRRRLKKQGYDIVHAHYGLAALSVALTATSVPLVVTLHGGDVNIRWQRILSRLAVRRAAHVLAVSAEMRERLGDPRAEVLACGVQMDWFRPRDRREARSRLGLDPDASVVLFPADPASNPVKNFPLFEAALAELPPAAQRRVVPRTLVDIPPEDVCWHMSAADVVVLTSDSEGSPMVVKEALASGIPVVSVDVGDVAAVISGVPGCRIVERDPGKIAEAVAPLLGSVDGGSEARRRRVFEIGLDGEAIARRLLSLYEASIRRPGQ